MATEINKINSLIYVFFTYCLGNAKTADSFIVLRF